MVLLVLRVETRSKLRVDTFKLKNKKDMVRCVLDYGNISISIHVTEPLTTALDVYPNGVVLFQVLANPNHLFH